MAVVGFVALLSTLAVLSPVTGDAGPAIGKFKCKGSDTYGIWSPVSAGANTFIVGNCGLGTELRRTYYSDVQNGPYFHGLIYGTFSGCGAVQGRNLTRVNSSDHISVCTGSAKRPYSEYLSLIDCRTNDSKCRAWDPDLAGDKTTSVVATCRAYANYRPFSTKARPTDPVQVIAPENRAQGDVRWRYITRDGKYVMVHDRKGRASGGAIWVFVSRGCVTTPHATTV